MGVSSVTGTLVVAMASEADRRNRSVGEGEGDCCKLVAAEVNEGNGAAARC